MLNKQQELTTKYQLLLWEFDSLQNTTEAVEQEYYDRRKVAWDSSCYFRSHLELIRRTASAFYGLTDKSIGLPRSDFKFDTLTVLTDSRYYAKLVLEDRPEIPMIPVVDSSLFDLEITRLYLKEIKSKKAQNEWIQSVNGNLEQELIRVADRNKVVLDYHKLLHSSIERVKHDCSVIGESFAELKPLLDQYKAKMDSLENEFRLKGPKGYSQGYFTYFTNVFPEKSEHLKSQPGIRKYVPESMEELKQMPFPDRVEIFEFSDFPAEFTGGKSAMGEYLLKNLVYPESARLKGLEGTVYLKFVVSKTGNISNVRVHKGMQDCKECDEEAMRVVKAMPNWIPAKNGGKNVNCWYNLPILFVVE